MNTNKTNFFDILYKNTSDVKPDILSIDNHGINRYNFTILHFFDYQFVPRYKTFKNHFEKLFQLESTETAESLITMRVPID